MLILFILLNIINVVLQTVKSICTVKCGRAVASIVNAVAYGLYTVVIIYMNCDLPLIVKVLVVALANFFGVYVVKFAEEKLNKDKLWKYEFTFPSKNLQRIDRIMKDYGINHYSKVLMNDGHLINAYTYSKEESEKVEQLIKDCDLKFFVTESKITLPT